MYLTSSSISRITRRVLRLEPVILLIIIVVFWFPTGGRVIDRADWLWLPLLYIPVVLARMSQTRRLPIITPLLALMGCLLLLGCLNVWFAPYTRGFLMLARPLLGAALIYTTVEITRANGQTDFIQKMLVGVSVFIGVLALGFTQWNEKSVPFAPLLSLLPQAAAWNIPGLEGGFNANEIGGALAWLVPPLAALAIHRWQAGLPCAGVSLAFVLTFVALFLGQSRMAILGVLVALAGIIGWLMPPGRARWIAWAGLALVTALQVALIAAPEQRARLDERDEMSLAARLAMWESGLMIIRDYPLTGVGMNAYRLRPVREQYPIPRYENRILPHIHNEPLQAAVDLGLPGLALFGGLYAAAAAMLAYGWRYGDSCARVLSLGLGGGLLAHAIYGMVDAITLWDRFAVLFWWLLGMAAAQYVAVKTSQESNDS